MSFRNHKISILVLEDDHELAAMTKISLEEVGFAVQTTPSVTEGISRSERQIFDCITLDLRLEKGTGTQFLDFIRKDKKNPNHFTPVIITSGYLDPYLVQELKGAVNSVLIKPFTQSQLIERVNKLVDEHVKAKKVSQ